VSNSTQEKEIGGGVSKLQSFYLNRIRSTKELMIIQCRDNKTYKGTVLSFDMYTVLISGAPLPVSDQSMNRQVLLYKNNIIGMNPLEASDPVDIKRYNKEYHCNRKE
jgi:sRNA-binding regulator protein Hfq